MFRDFANISPFRTTEHLITRILGYFSNLTENNTLFCYRITELQNSWSCKGLLEVIMFKACSVWGTQLVDRYHVQIVFEYSQPRDSIISPDNLCHCLITLKICFLIFRGSLLSFRLYPLHFSCHWTSWKRACLHLCISLQVFINFYLSCWTILSGIFLVIFFGRVKAEPCDHVCWSGLSVPLRHDVRLLTALFFSPQSCFIMNIDSSLDTCYAAIEDLWLTAMELS